MNKKYTSRYTDYIKSPEWDDFRKFAYKVFEYKCWFCEKTNTEVHLHHTKYYKTTLGKTKRLFHNRLRWFLVLCKECHMAVHAHQKETGLDTYRATKSYRDIHHPKKKMNISRKRALATSRATEMMGET